ncbi:secretory of YscJ/FliF family protein [Chlamydia ibidis]|uniref:Secretory of YscJ/FliF family protein n=2 Tax=Chlamydia ibidis TaxID=1405396 RepID=S7J288_9CHLA|nr:secretory of YscJ/FliF family protein [Chlamydia ibidis]EPP34539.1 secretory of YscJ/FliF family protein [Chlamydia ibidis]EQM62256.1 hypothetical protein H359_1013 [Chlamydia ibidis 10-1398/6]
MFLQFLKKKFSLLRISPLYFFALGGLGLTIFLGKTPTSSLSSSYPQSEKKTTSWFKLTQVGNPKLLESLVKKEQLEKDLTNFEPIANATVAISLSEEEEVSPQLSAILTLKKDAVLSPSLRQSIIDYLVSSVYGLQKEHITLSDNFGQIYSDNIAYPNPASLSRAKEYLSKLLPQRHFTLLHLNTEGSPIIQFLINENYINSLQKNKRERILQHSLNYINQTLDNGNTVQVEILPFSKDTTNRTLILQFIIGGMVLLSSLAIVGLASFYLASYAYEAIPKDPKKIKRGINIGKLVEILQKESPEKIALILSYLDPKKADELFKQLPESTQKQVLEIQQ